MKFRAPVLAGILFVLTLCVDLLIYFSSHKLAAVMLVTATCVTFFATLLWYRRKKDNSLGWQKLWSIPFFALGYGAIAYIVNLKSFEHPIEQENLLVLGQLMMTRLQGIHWVTGLMMIVLLSFGASLMTRKHD